METDINDRLSWALFLLAGFFMALLVDIWSDDDRRTAGQGMTRSVDLPPGAVTESAAGQQQPETSAAEVSASGNTGTAEALKPQRR